VGRKFIGPEDLAKWLQISPRTIQQWRARRQGPPYVRVSYKQVRYAVEDVESWLATRESAH
jgi:predicted DNA-binding transcriptional regulator AlpA